MIAQIAVSAAVYAIDKPYSYAVPPGTGADAGRTGDGSLWYGGTEARRESCCPWKKETRRS